MHQQADDIAGVYRQHGHVVLRRARQILGNEDEAFDVVQEVFLSLVARPEQFAGRSSVIAWLYSATTHLCLNRLRNRRNRARLLDLHGTPLHAESDPSNMEIRAVIQQKLATLPDELARIAVYYYLDEMTHEEIARVMGCSRRHIGNLIQRLGKRLMRAERNKCPTI